MKANSKEIKNHEVRKLQRWIALNMRIDIGLEGAKNYMIALKRLRDEESKPNQKQKQ